MTEKAENTGLIQDNFVQTFQLESSNLRGRIVRLGGVLDDILTAHDYPVPISHMVGETITLAAALSAMMKYEGIFTLQAQGDGAVKMVVSDLTSAGVIRGCASFDEGRFEKAAEKVSGMETKEGSQNHLAQYLGKGYMAFTVDQGGNRERYQGIVELKGASLVDCVRHYFTQSEQIGTGIKMAVGKRSGKWRAGAIMLQHFPEDEKNPMQGHGNIAEDDWRRAMILLDSCTDHEFLDSEMDSHELLIRLFHEEGIRVYERKTLMKGCRCDEQRVVNILATLSDDDMAYVAVDGQVTMTCEFCSKNYIFGQDEIRARIKAIKDKV